MSHILCPSTVAALPGNASTAFSSQVCLTQNDLDQLLAPHGSITANGLNFLLSHVFVSSLKCSLVTHLASQSLLGRKAEHPRYISLGKLFRLEYALAAVIYQTPVRIMKHLGSTG